MQRPDREVGSSLEVQCSRPGAPYYCKDSVDYQRKWRCTCLAESAHCRFRTRSARRQPAWDLASHRRLTGGSPVEYAQMCFMTQSRTSMNRGVIYLWGLVNRDYAFEFKFHKLGLFFQQESPAQGWSHGFPYNSLRKTQMFSIRHQQHGWKWRRSAPIGRCLAHLLEYWALVCRALMMVAEMSWRSYRTKLEYLCKIIACRIVSPDRWNIDDLCFYSGPHCKINNWILHLSFRKQFCI